MISRMISNFKSSSDILFDHIGIFIYPESHQKNVPLTPCSSIISIIPAVLSAPHAASKLIATFFSFVSTLYMGLTPVVCGSALIARKNTCKQITAITASAIPPVIKSFFYPYKRFSYLSPPFPDFYFLC